jgi:hypothetical protein
MQAAKAKRTMTRTGKKNRKAGTKTKRTFRRKEIVQSSFYRPVPPIPSYSLPLVYFMLRWRNKKRKKQCLIVTVTSVIRTIETFYSLGSNYFDCSKQ